MKINVSNIPAEGLKLHFSKDAKWFVDLWPSDDRMNFAFHDAGLSFSLKKIGETVFIEGKVVTTVELECCRCLERTTKILHGDFKYTFEPSRSHDNEEIELSVEDLEISYYDNDLIDLDQIAFEQIALQIPMKALCSESCKGLCPQCGMNLNLSSCQCRSDFVDDRLAVLKDFKVKE
ncbi:MAG: DUF177 domain-containing protein [Deltaproteobacteria bacterium]|nr:DUF177 domain-containing protein [Deltaproteobacteria bacterium]